MPKYLSRVAIALLAVGAAYGLSSVLRVNHFVWTLLKGRYYEYVLLFLPLLAMWCCAYVIAPLQHHDGFVRLSAVGVTGGYVCGLLAFLLLPIFGNDASRRIFTVRDLGDGTVFLSPVIALSWVVGLIAAWFMWAFAAKTKALS